MQFRKHPVIEGLEISEDGKILKLNGRRLPIKDYKVGKSQSLQQRVTVVQKTVNVAKLVCETYHGMRPDGSFSVVRKVPNSVHPNDLYWGKQGDSFKYKQQRPNSKITHQDIKDIEALLAQGKKPKEIAEMYKVSIGPIYQIKQKKYAPNAQEKKNK